MRYALPHHALNRSLIAPSIFRRPCHVKCISLNCFWNRFFVAAVNEAGEGPEAESSITTASVAGMARAALLSNVVHVRSA